MNETRQAKVLTKVEARRIAINIGRLPELLERQAAAELSDGRRRHAAVVVVGR
jgi:hypothetical protein